MATLSHLGNFPTFISLSSHKLLFSSPIPSPNLHINPNHNHHPYHSTISASSLKKPRGSKKVKSNADLCNDIREFLSSIGLSDDHVPSLKELSQHGRQDLANIVRRRGYKFIKQLLETSTTRNFTGSSIEGQNEKLNVLDDDILPSEAVQEANLYNSVESDDEVKLNDQSSLASELTTLSLEEKVDKYTHNEEVDRIEDSNVEITNERHADEAEGTVEAENAREIVNGNASSFVNSYISTEDQVSSDKDLNFEKNQKMENQAEIKSLNFLLHQKEMELTKLKQQIEKEKLALSVLQAKAETEISKAQKIVYEKDSELYAAEENLSGLKEVEIQYSGDGENVELAGSFNGWHQKIKMDPQRSSSITSLTGSRFLALLIPFCAKLNTFSVLTFIEKNFRTSRIWKAVLWLYPGVYEIKFVIDGHWRTDPQRELITRGGAAANDEGLGRQACGCVYGGGLGLEPCLAIGGGWRRATAAGWEGA
ncbi:hypothetical protein BUALT_Bualt11G0107700 [Buddleja alternifolia]|uniref:AMP-activated protein kinase glycogen-binding domain-containing protein n=1 Tax=Buddleja alternifolia TaxID=168488 RepID=A0AAV6X4Y5_9LAMI|nr:hypothetical protein BUALT_Bualt11G0107700 [Buddleja alternifolia]